MQKVGFEAYGHAITDIVRDLFWNKERPSVCMSGPDQSEENRLRYGRDVYLGRSKFVRLTDDGANGLVEDGGDNLLKNLQQVIYDKLLESFLEARRHDDNYGWLSPAGAFTPVDFADHAQWAMDYVLERGWLKQVAEAEVSDAKDFLILKKGWVLLHNPQQGTAIVTSAPDRRLTKAQREFLYDYYIKRSRMDLAEAYLEEEIS